MELGKFANGEVKVRYDESVRREDVFIIQTTGDARAFGDYNANDFVVETQQLADAAQRSSASWTTLVAPNMAYGRQDRQTRGRESPFGATLLSILGFLGVKRLVTFDAHSQQVQSAFPGPVDNLTARPIIEKRLAKEISEDPERYVLVAPDTGSAKSSESYATALGTDLRVIIKARDPRTGEIRHINRIDGVGGRHCIMVDDMIDTAGTIVQAADVLKDSGAKSITVATTHGLFSDPAFARLKDSSIDRIFATDTLPQDLAQEVLGDRLEVLSIAPTLAEAMFRIATGGSISEMFKGKNSER